MRKLTSLELAFLGDSIHTTFVRKWALENLDKPINEIHKVCARLCSAKAQSLVLEKLELSEQEQTIVRRARNAKPKHQAKNADGADYKKATALEALIGHLYSTEQPKRLQEILQISII